MRAPWLMMSVNDDEEDPHFRKAAFDADHCPPGECDGVRWRDGGKGGTGTTQPLGVVDMCVLWMFSLCVRVCVCVRAVLMRSLLCSCLCWWRRRGTGFQPVAYFRGYNAY